MPTDNFAARSTNFYRRHILLQCSWAARRASEYIAVMGLLGIMTRSAMKQARAT